MSTISPGAQAASPGVFRVDFGRFKKLEEQVTPPTVATVTNEYGSELLGCIDQHGEYLASRAAGPPPSLGHPYTSSPRASVCTAPPVVDPNEVYADIARAADTGFAGMHLSSVKTTSDTDSGTWSSSEDVAPQPHAVTVLQEAERRRVAAWHKRSSSVLFCGFENALGGLLPDDGLPPRPVCHLKPLVDPDLLKLRDSVSLTDIPTVKHVSTVNMHMMENPLEVMGALANSLTGDDPRFWTLLSEADCMINRCDVVVPLKTALMARVRRAASYLALTVRIKMASAAQSKLAAERRALAMDAQQRRRFDTSPAWVTHAQRTLEVERLCRELVLQKLYMDKYHLFEEARQRRATRVWRLWCERTGMVRR